MGTQFIGLLEIAPRLGQNCVHIVVLPKCLLVEFLDFAHFHIGQASTEERTLGGCHDNHLQTTVEAAGAAGANTPAAKRGVWQQRHSVRRSLRSFNPQLPMKYEVGFLRP